MMIANATVESATKYAVKSGLPMHQIVAIQMIASASSRYSEQTMLAIIDTAFAVTMGTLLTKGVIDDADLEEIRVEFTKHVGAAMEALP